MSSAAFACRLALSPPESSFAFPSKRRNGAVLPSGRRRKRLPFPCLKALASKAMEDGFVVVEDDIHALLEVHHAGNFHSLFCIPLPVFSFSSAFLRESSPVYFKGERTQF